MMCPDINRNLSDYYDQSRGFAITAIISGSCSFLCSLTIIVIVFRTHNGGLSTIFHRLLVGISMTDMIASLPYILSSAMVPREMEEMVWNARGNLASCRAQGFISVFGILVCSSYTCSMCLYFLSVVKFGKSEDYIRSKFEPYLHGVPFAIGLTAAILGLATDSYVPSVSSCFIGSFHPPHCEGIPDGTIVDGGGEYQYTLECGKGSLDTYMGLFWLFFAQNLILLPCTIIVSMSMMYLEVRKQEMKSEKYGIGSLNLLSTEVTRSSTSLVTASRGVTQRFKIRKDRQRRSVLFKASAYALAYLATYMIPNILVVKIIKNPCNTQFDLSSILSLAFILFPFQGGFNFCVFMSSRIWNAKMSKRAKRTWREATVHAFTSRGFKSKLDQIEKNKIKPTVPHRLSKMVSFTAIDSRDIEQGVTTEVPLQEDSRHESHCEEISHRLDSVENIKSRTTMGPKSLSYQAVALRSKSSQSARPFSYFHSIPTTELITKTGRQASVENASSTARNDCVVDDDGTNGDEERNGFLNVDHNACRTSLSAEEENKGACINTIDGSRLDRISTHQAKSAKEGTCSDIPVGQRKDKSNTMIEHGAQQSGNEDKDNRDNVVRACR